MYKITLINMPFANLSIPSIALTQLKSVVEDRFKDQVSVDVLYVNHDFANYLGLRLYDLILSSDQSQNSGLGDWFFRQTAFPELPDNSAAYLSRYFPYRTPQMDKLRSAILEKRLGLDQFFAEVISKHALDRPDIVGFTSMFMQNVASFSLARKIKQRNPRITTVMGGANCESPMGQVIVKRVAAIDYVFSGPGLKSFPDFVGHCLAKEMWKCGSIKGVFTKKNYMFQTGLEAIGEELSIDVPVQLDYQPFLDTLERNFAGNPIEPILLFETSRGCWWGERAHCTFCGLNGSNMAYRSMSPDMALKQFDSLFKFAPKVSRLEAVDNILPKNYLSEVLPFVKTPESMSMFYEVKADLSESDMQVLARARVKFIQPGIESLNTSTLKLMKKGTSAFRNLALLKFCSTCDIRPSWNLLVGFPGEGEEVYKKYIDDLPLLTHLAPPGGVYPVRFDRYSPYFMKAAEYGLDLHPLDYYHLTYPFPKEELDDLAYYFTDLHIGSDYVQTMVLWIGKVRDKVNRWLSSWKNNGQAPPQLFFRDNTNRNGRLIYDSRSGQVVEHKIGELGGRVLESLASKPKDLVDLAREFHGVAGFDAAQEIELLREKGFVFQENGRFLSVVLQPANGRQS